MHEKRFYPAISMSDLSLHWEPCGEQLFFFCYFKAVDSIWEQVLNQMYNKLYRTDI